MTTTQRTMNHLKPKWLKRWRRLVLKEVNGSITGAEMIELEKLDARRNR
jgi:hypothetical protein